MHSRHTWFHNVSTPMILVLSTMWTAKQHNCDTHAATNVFAAADLGCLTKQICLRSCAARDARGGVPPAIPISVLLEEWLCVFTVWGGAPPLPYVLCVVRLLIDETGAAYVA